MDSSLNFHREPPPSNSGLKKRPAPIIRPRIKPSTLDLDDPVPLESKLFYTLHSLDKKINKIFVHLFNQIVLCREKI